MCGIFGVYSNNANINNLNILINCLKLLQHRGKDGFGIGYTTHPNKYPKIIKNHGLVNELILNDDSTNTCIGHVRYSTSGKSSKDQKLDLTKTTELQPLSGKNKHDDSIIIVHNANIPIIKGHYDTQIILQLILNKYM